LSVHSLIAQGYTVDFELDGGVIKSKTGEVIKMDLNNTGMWIMPRETTNLKGVKLLIDSTDPPSSNKPKSSIKHTQPTGGAILKTKGRINAVPVRATSVPSVMTHHNNEQKSHQADEPIYVLAPTQKGEVKIRYNPASWVPPHHIKLKLYVISEGNLVMDTGCNPHSMVTEELRSCFTAESPSIFLTIKTASRYITTSFNVG
jgi:hypothetical protein